jgi:hypothetical protein
MALDEADVDANGQYRRQELVPGFWPSASYALDIPHASRHESDETSNVSNAGVALSRLGPAAAFLGGVLGCLAALSLSALGFAPAIASALATVLLCGPLLLTPPAQRLPGEFYSAIYGGSFAGMTPVLWLCSGTSVGAGLPVCISFVSLTLVCGLAFALVAWLELHLGHPLARGFGGRSGAIATAASFLFVALAPLFGGDDSLFRTDRAEALDADPELTLTYIACTVGMFVTLAVLRLPRLMAAVTGDRTLAAAALALAGLLVLHLYGAKDLNALNAFYAGCFLGMSTPDRLRGALQPVLGAIILTALLIEERVLLCGIGGSLGLAAFVTMLVLTALSWMLAAVTGAVPPRTIVPPSVASRRLAPPIMRATALWPEPMLPVAARSPVKVPLRRSRMIFAPMAGALAMAGLLLPIDLSPDEPAPSVVASRPAAKPEPAPEHAALMLATASAVDATRALANLHTGSTGPSTSAGHPAMADVKAYAEEPAATELDTGGVPVVARQEQSEKLFREFLQWSASHEAAGAQPGVQPAAPRHDVKRAAHPATAVLTGAPRPVSERRPVRAVTVMPTARRVAAKPLPGPSGNPD